MDRKRFYDLAGDRLTQRPPPLLTEGEQVEGNTMRPRAKEHVRQSN